MKVKRASIEIPINLNGNETSHTTGNSSNANNARGQHRTNKMHQPTNRIRAFIDE